MKTVSEVIKGWLGWCPMEAAAKARNDNDMKSMNTRNTGDRIDGPAVRRERLFSRMAWGVTGLSYILALAVLPILPETIPVHWNYAGVADGFAGKFPSVFTFPVILTLMMILTRIMPRFQLMRISSVISRDIYAIITFSTACMLFAVQAVSLANAAGLMVPIVMILPMLLGVVFIIIGSLFPIIGYNRLMGIRLPWTLKDEKNWKMTHERGGPVFMGAGILIVLGSPFAGTWAIVLTLVTLAAAVIYITYYSYRLSKTGGTGV
ncbi:MAG TPA: SdpI family protein [Methanoregula sp.]|nr:SdpI family protein [Methanoregula sp.]